MTDTTDTTADSTNTTADTTVAATTTATPVAASETDVLLEKLKAALKFAGHEIDVVWDEAVALAKKLV
ncbi:hypothetical protein [Pseudomonas typographi]|uniref:hypothetical protein n=1 Tax=Pseudomonas typographi TaxID=2715964 RepID=UPI0016860973|nr:hypothetical protein [Pseudomonas typographi]MBD1555021.1 hypothetical protein [Pseudomonas typographi]